MNLNHVLYSTEREELNYLRERVAKLEAMQPYHGRTLRNIANHHEWCNGQDYCGCPDNPQVWNPDEAELICSDVSPGRHKPVIDLDLACELVPSATPGHYHLYINRDVEEQKFFSMLDAMAAAGVVEPGYARASRWRGYSAVRNPLKPKPKPLLVFE